MMGDQSSPLGMGQKLVLLLVALGLASGLLFLKGGFNSDQPLDELARRSLNPEVALSNGRPTIIEFYADWCEACREMAPTMLEMEKRTENQLNIVLVNVDNPTWQDLIDRYEVHGIPQLNLFDNNGKPLGRSLGVRTPEQLKQITDALIQDQPLPNFGGMGPISELEESTRQSISTAKKLSSDPRSHGQPI